MRFHVLSVPHTVTSKEYLSCAFTQKVLNMCKMLKLLGHEVLHYGVEGATVEADTTIDVLTREELIECYGDYDWKKEFFRHGINNKASLLFTQRTADHLKKHQREKDFVLCHWGIGHEKIAKQINGAIVVEPGIGYETVFADFKVFESYAWMHWIYGKDHLNLGRWYDAVIPNYFDPDDFVLNNEKDDYFLYLGRIIENKGLRVAIDVTKEIGAKLLIAGQGDINLFKDHDISHCEFVGFADLSKRKELLSSAKALFVPTYYIEPFGGVVVEAAFCGTPTITTDWGGFSETVLHGKTGFRCRTLEQFIWAATNIERIRPRECFAWANNNYSIYRIKDMYQEYFTSLYQLWGEGWNTRNLSRTELDWLRKY